MSIACLQLEIDSDEKLSTTLKKKLNQQIHFRMCGNGCLFMWRAYFCMGAYKRDVVFVIKMCAYIHGCLFSMGAYYPDFMVLIQARPILSNKTTPCSIALL